jgi:hypothetical protein
MARGASVAGSAILKLERDLRVDTIVGDSIVVDGRFHLLDIERPSYRHANSPIADRIG